MDPTDQDFFAETVSAEAERGADASGPLVGSVLAGRYEIVDFIGAGGMGEVYRARDRELDDIVAVKVLRVELADRSDLVERFRNEVRLARRVTHRSVARTFELGEADGLRFLTMEFVEGEPLSSVVSRQSRLGVDATTRIAADVCDALDASHASGIVHRDIKPDNIMLTRSGRAVVTDFGVAQLASHRSRDTSGTPQYMSPEQVRGEPPTPQSDLYSLGATLFEVATGRPPFSGATPLAMMIARLNGPPPDPRDVASDLPASLADLIRCAMALEPKDRFLTAKEMRAACLALAGRRSQQPWAIEVEARSVHSTPWTTVEVRPIERTPPDRAYLTSALHAEIMLSLGRVPLVRAVTKADDASEADVVVTGTVVEPGSGASSRPFERSPRVSLRAVRTTSQETLWSARIPLAAARLPALAETLQIGLSAALGVDRPAHDHDATASDVIDLCLRARHHFSRAIEAESARATHMYEQALAVEPNDPRALAGLAMATVRHAFFARSAPTSLERAQAACAAALRAAGDRPEPRIAAGHLALHTSDPVRAASMFREAMAMAPAWPESHEWLGRMLVETGYVNDGIHRLRQAVRLEPTLVELGWEIARARALDGAWADFDLEVASTLRLGATQRWLGRVRFAGWRGDPIGLRALAAELDRVPESEIFDPPIVRAMLDAHIGGAYAKHAALFESRALQEPFASVRRSIFYGQIASELSCAAGDNEASSTFLVRATELGLFDLHWLDRCPLLEPLRSSSEFARIRSIVADRAHRVFDALYGS